MGKGEPDPEEILDTLEIAYAWHAMPGRDFFKRCGDMTIYSKMWGAVRSTPGRVGRDLEQKSKCLSET
jgi:hypothetical protein